MTRQQKAEAYGYKIVPSLDFYNNEKDVPAGLRKRAASYRGSFVLYDPDDDDEGFLLIGDDPEQLGKLWDDQHDLPEV